MDIYDSFQIIESHVQDYKDESVFEDQIHKQCLHNLEQLEEKVEMLNCEVNSLRIERDMPRGKVNTSKFSYKFPNNDEKVLFFTGVPSLECFNWLFDLVSSGLPKFPSLSCKDAALLLKLRLNLLHQDLAY